MDYNKLMEYLLNLKYIFKLRKRQKTEINWTKPNSIMKLTPATLSISEHLE